MGRYIHSLVNEFPMVISGANPDDLDLDVIIRLWNGVMEQALFDASYGLHRYYMDGKLDYKIDKRRWSPHSTLVKYYKEAQHWFMDGDDNFVEVCDILELNPGIIRIYAIDMFKEINKHVPVKWRIKNGSFKLV